MGRPSGSKNKPKTELIVNDGYAEAFSGLGTNRDRNSYTRSQRGYLLDQQTALDTYLSDGFGRKIVDIPAEEMTRSGIELEDLDDDNLEQYVMAKLDELDAFCYYNDAIRWSRLFGGALVVYGLNDGNELDMPLNVTGIKDVEFMRVYDRYEATVQKKSEDPASVDYGKPELWLISPKTGGTPYMVHNSRVWRFDGESIPNQLRQQNEGWGASSLQQCIDALKRFGTSHQWTLAMMERSQQAIHKIPQLANTLRAPGGDAMIQKRVNVVDMVRGILNTVVVDSEEDYNILSTSMTGIPEVLDRFSEALSAVSGIPVSVLMGRQKGGLANTDKSSMDTWYARVESMWNDILRKPEDKLVGWIIQSKTGTPATYKICMKPLTVLSEKEKAEIEKLEAEAFNIRATGNVAYVTANVVDPTEVRSTVEDEYNLAEGSAAPDVPVEDNNYVA